MPNRDHAAVATNNRDYAQALGRAFAGALIFSLPLLMTMEMWTLGHSVKPWMLLQFLLFHLVILFGLSKVAGFEQSRSWLDDILDSFSAYGVAAITSVVVLSLFNVIQPGQSAAEIASKVMIQIVPASFGAMIGASLLGEGDKIEAKEHWRETYSGRLFLMLAGGLFLSFTVAPTEEMILISSQMTALHGLVLVALSIALLHLFVYRFDHIGAQRRRTGDGPAVFWRYTMPGYGIAVLVSFYILWTFGRVGGLDPGHAALAVAVLAFPASIGAGIARVII